MNISNAVCEETDKIKVGQDATQWLDVLTHCGREGSFKLFKRPFPGFLTILTL